MDLYIALLDSKHNPKEPKYEYEGKLIHHGLVKDKDTRFGTIKSDDDADIPLGLDAIITTHIKSKTTSKIIVYLNGKRITSKTVLSDKTIYQESDRLMIAIIMDIKLGYL